MAEPLPGSIEDDHRGPCRQGEDRRQRLVEETWGDADDADGRAVAGRRGVLRPSQLGSETPGRTEKKRKEIGEVKMG